MRSVRNVRRMLSAALIVLLALIGTAVTFTDRSEGLLTAFGLQNLRYFTVDSNLFLALVCLAELIAGLMGKTELWLERLRYMATVAVALTFTVVAVFFGPFVGFAPLYRNGNLFFHLLIPVAAILSFCLLYRRTVPLRETFLALIPSVLYGIYYTAVLLVRGVRFPETDWYGFAAGGLVGSVLSAAGIFLTTWLLALLLRRLCRPKVDAARK